MSERRVQKDIPAVNIAEIRAAVAPMLPILRRFLQIDEVLAGLEIAEVRLAEMTRQQAEVTAALAHLHQSFASDVEAYEAWQGEVRAARDAWRREREHQGGGEDGGDTNPVTGDGHPGTDGAPGGVA